MERMFETKENSWRDIYVGFLCQYNEDEELYMIRAVAP